MHASIVQRLFFPHIIDDEFIDAILAHVTESIRALDISNMRRRKAQKLIEETAKRAIAEMWTAAFRKTYKPNNSWPGANAILLDNPRRAVVELWIGHDYHDDEIPDPIEVFFDSDDGG
jgi:hypothetical protein